MAKSNQNKQLEFSFSKQYKEYPSISPERSRMWFVMIRAVMRGDIDADIAIDVMNSDYNSMVDFEKVDLWHPCVDELQLN